MYGDEVQSSRSLRQDDDCSDFPSKQSGRDAFKIVSAETVSQTTYYEITFHHYHSGLFLPITTTLSPQTIGMGIHSIVVQLYRTCT